MSWLPGLPGGERTPSGGERIDDLGNNAVSLAFKVLDRFPDLVKRHKYIAGGAAISGSLIALAGVAVARRMNRGATAEEAVEAVTEDEITGLHLISDRHVTVEETDGETPGNGGRLPEDLASDQDEAEAADEPTEADAEALDEPSRAQGTD